MTTVAITLRDADERFIEEAVKSGAYVTKSEVVAKALELLKAREEIRKARRAELKKEIQKGLDELDRGETVEFDLPSFLAAMHAKHSSDQA
jgi:antitoxin ParD1/3/4